MKREGHTVESYKRRFAALRPESACPGPRGPKRAVLSRYVALSRRAALVIPALVIPALALMSPGVAASQTPTRSLLEARQARVVIQHWDMSCGAAALATILNYQYNEPITEREIAIEIMRRKEYLANPMLVRARQGYSLLDLQGVVERRHYKGLGFGHLSKEDLVARAPMIVPVKFLGYYHCVVFRGIYRGQVVLADPGWGNRTMSIGAFERAWVDYPTVGRTGFSVLPADASQPTNRLAPTANDLLLAYVAADGDDDHEGGAGPRTADPVLLAGPGLDLPAAPGLTPELTPGPAADPSSPPQPPEVTRPAAESTVVAASGESPPASSPLQINTLLLTDLTGDGSGYVAEHPLQVAQRTPSRGLTSVASTQGPLPVTNGTAAVAISSPPEGTEAASKLITLAVITVARTAAQIDGNATQPVGTKGVTGATQQALTTATQAAANITQPAATLAKGVTSTLPGTVQQTLSTTTRSVAEATQRVVGTVSNVGPSPNAAAAPPNNILAVPSTTNGGGSAAKGVAASATTPSSSAETGASGHVGTAQSTTANPASHPKASSVSATSGTQADSGTRPLGPSVGSDSSNAAGTASNHSGSVQSSARSPVTSAPAASGTPASNTGSAPSNASSTANKQSSQASGMATSAIAMTSVSSPTTTAVPSTMPLTPAVH
jgi:predicted double-glycine peptidase